MRHVSLTITATATDPILLTPPLSFSRLIHRRLAPKTQKIEKQGEKTKRGTMLCKTLKERWILTSLNRIFKSFIIIFIIFIISPPFFFAYLALSNIPPTNTTSSFSITSTTSTSSIPSTNRRSKGLHPYIYSRLWLFQI